MIDTNEVNQNADLLALVGNATKLKRVSSTNGGEFAGACPFCGGRDRFRVQPNYESGRWFCRGCGGGRWHDAIAYVMRRDSVDFKTAVASLNDGQLPKSEPVPIKETTPNLSQPPGPDWQGIALTAVSEAAHYLHSGKPDALKALRYLKENRGLTEGTIFNASLGYNPEWKQYSNYWLPPGIVIPCLIGSDFWYVQVRTTKAARQSAQQNGRKLDKYHAFSGSHLAAIYGANHLIKAQTAVIVEGEFDALLLGQYVPEGWAVATMGSASSRPSLRWRLFLGHLRKLFIFHDRDTAGEQGAAAWRDLVPFVEDMPPGPALGQDVTDYWQTGGDLAAWLDSVKG